MRVDHTEDSESNIIREILKSDRYTFGEKEYVKFQFGLSDRYCADFWKAVGHADDKILARLRKVFPEEIAAFSSWKRGDLARRLLDDGLSI